MGFPAGASPGSSSVIRLPALPPGAERRWRQSVPPDFPVGGLLFPAWGREAGRAEGVVGIRRGDGVVLRGRGIGGCVPPAWGNQANGGHGPGGRGKACRLQGRGSPPSSTTAPFPGLRRAAGLRRRRRGGFPSRGCPTPVGPWGGRPGTASPLPGVPGNGVPPVRPPACQGKAGGRRQTGGEAGRPSASPPSAVFAWLPVLFSFPPHRGVVWFSGKGLASPSPLPFAGRGRPQAPYCALWRALVSRFARGFGVEIFSCPSGMNSFQGSRNPSGAAQRMALPRILWTFSLW